MHDTANIVSVPNVWSSSLRVIAAKGFMLSAECRAPEGAALSEKYSKLDWVAQRENIKLIAPNPTELLGLVALVEHQTPKSFEPYWWVVDGEDLLEKILEPIGLSNRPKKNAI